MEKLIKFVCDKCNEPHYENLLTGKIKKVINEEDYIIVTTKHLDMWNCCI